MRPGAPTSKTRFSWRLSPFDVTWAIIAPFIALGLRNPALLNFGGHGLPHSYQYAAVTIAYAVPAFLFFRLSEGMSRYLSAQDIWSVVAATLTVVAASDVTMFVINRLEGVPRSTPLIYGLVLGAGLLGGRALAQWLHRDRPREIVDGAEPHLRRIVLVGVDHFAATVIKLTDCQQPRTTQIIVALDARERLNGRTINGVKIVGRPGDLEAVVDEYVVHGIEIDEVWLADNAMTRREMERIEHQCRALGVRARPLAEALNLSPRHAPPFRESRPQPQIVAPHAATFRFKRVLDVVVATILLIILAPLAAAIVVLTYFDVGAPVTFWQQRIGRGGREFFLFKFRTYKAPFHRNGGPVAHDSRLSKIGAVIRATRLDEIPQLFNILRGDMSLIGPRPLLPVDQPADPRSRLLVRPGVTGWAQVIGGTAVSAEEKDALDVWYIHHATPLLDLKIILRTLKVVFHGEKKHNGEIEEAVQWRATTRLIDQQLFGGDKKADEQAPSRAGQSGNLMERASLSHTT